MLTRPEPEVGSREWKDNYIYDNPYEFFKNFPEEAKDRDSHLLAIELYRDEAFVGFGEDEILDDEDFMSKAVTKYPSAFGYASSRLRDDFAFASMCVEKDMSNMRYISERLHADRKFLVAMVELHPPGRVSALDNLPLPSASDYFSEDLKEKIGGIDARVYFRREELFERLQSTVPKKAVETTRKRKI